mmetsp:Transcript_23639/g.65572  ORF Transcript_23639/g.65572 Transcript_23639/m.65572 type:complete len:85 (+) Transcript_23639:1043-1297(+)
MFYGSCVSRFSDLTSPLSPLLSSPLFPFPTSQHPLCSRPPPLYFSLLSAPPVSILRSDLWSVLHISIRVPSLPPVCSTRFPCWL